MKNQYFGDVNDYRKYGLLRALQAHGKGRLLVAWMLTSDDGSRDGRFRSYLREPDRWRHYDPELFDGLAALLRSARVPDVSLIERSGLLPSACYYSAVVPDSRENRDAWRLGLLNAASEVDLVFVDPDNGIEVPSKPVGRKDSSKYVTWSDVEGLWKLGCSVLIYQHFRREPREAFAARMVSELRDHTGAPFTEGFRTPHVLFLLAAQERHESRFREVPALLRQRCSQRGLLREPGVPRCWPSSRPSATSRTRAALLARPAHHPRVILDERGRERSASSFQRSARFGADGRMRDFRDLEVWQKARGPTPVVHGETRGFRRDEPYGPSRRLRRAASSIPANIAEGCGRSTDRDFARFLDVAAGSGSELEYHPCSFRGTWAFSSSPPAKASTIEPPRSSGCPPDWLSVSEPTADC